jgi:UreF
MFAESMRGTSGFNTVNADDARIELLRAVGLCHPGWIGVRRVTFSPHLRSTPEWLLWKEEIFAAVFLPRIEEARSASAAGDWQALADCDHAIDRSLPFRLREASSLAGRGLMEHYSAPKSERLWPRYQSLVGSGKAPGHLAILCALRGVIFHLPPAAILGAYILLEAKGGLPRSEIELWVNMVGDCLAQKCGPKTFNLRAA